jgi:hypothetical protein
MFCCVGCSLLRAEDVLHGDLEINKMQFLIRCNIFQFLVIKTLDPHPKLDPDPQ